MPKSDITYGWNKLFRERIIALCFIPDWFSRFGYSIVKSEYMETPQEQELVKFVVGFYRKYKRVPDEDEILSAFEENDDVQELLFNVVELLDDGEDLAYAESQALQFAKEQAMKLAILDSITDIEKGILSKLIPRVKDALAVGQDLSDLGIDLKKDTSIWIPDDISSEKIPTGIQHLDDALGGGVGRGEYAVFLGSTNVGKTQALINVGMGAAGHVKKANVVHITLEMSAKKIARRYGARISNWWYDEEIGYAKYLEQFNKMSQLRIPGNVIIKQYPSRTATLHTIETYLDRLEVNGFIPDLLLIDYPDIMRHENIGEYRHNISHTTLMLRDLAVERNMAIVGASQANRAALNKEIVDLDMIAEDYGKVQTADIVMALCQTKEEYESNIMRIFGAKVRDGEKYWIVKCKQYPEQHAIESEELMTFSEMLDKRRERSKQLLKEEREESNMTKVLKQVKERTNSHAQ